MKIIDVSITLSEDYPAWPGDDPFRYWETSRIADGAHANCAGMSLSVHFATHVDAPYHFVADGKTIDEIEPELLIGPCLVIDLSSLETEISAADVAFVPQGTRRLLIKTRNSEFLLDRHFHPDYVALSEEAAKVLVEKGVRLLGLDYLSIAPYGRSQPTHVAFLGAGGVAIEGVNLRDVAPGLYQLLCLPLKVKGSGGAPARVFLVKE